MLIVRMVLIVTPMLIAIVKMMFLSLVVLLMQICVGDHVISNGRDGVAASVVIMLQILEVMKKRASDGLM